MQVWDRRATYLFAALLIFMAVGHTFSFPATSQSLAEAGIDKNIADAIRVVWLTISAMLLLFGLLLIREALSKTAADWMMICAIGCLLSASGAAGLIFSAGEPFWWQQVGLGLAVVAIGWRTWKTSPGRGHRQGDELGAHHPTGR